MMSCMTSSCCMCIGHMTNYYKRPQMPWLGFSSVSSVHLRLSSGWYLICIGCDASSASLGGSLLPSTIIIVLAGADPGFDQGGPQIVTGLKLPFWGLSFVEFWCWGLIFGGQGGGGPGPRGPPWIRPWLALVNSTVSTAGDL